MTMRLAGVALAAVVGACALSCGTQRVEAATITYSGSGDFGYGQSYEGLTYNTATKTGSAFYNSFYYDEITYDQDGNPQPYFQGGISGSGSRILKVGYDLVGAQVSVSITVAADFGGSGYAFGDPFDYTGQRELTIYASGDLTRKGNVLSGFAFGGSDGPVSGLETGFLTVDLSPVPLPASAPLFAAALLSLGGMGIAARKARSA